jgi:hypothetical protein
MKKIFTFLALLVALCVHSQSYHPMLETNKYWDVFSWATPSMTQYTSGRREFIQGDTVFTTKQYKILRGRNFYSLQPVFAPPYYLHDTSYIIGLIREDTLSRRVYYQELWGYPLPPEYLIYDFSLGAGDSLYVGYYSSDSNYIHVDSIGTYTLQNSDFRKIFYFSGSPEAESFLYCGNYLIEGIGGSASLEQPFDVCFEFGTDLMCVKDNTGWLYDGYHHLGDCDLATGIHPLNSSEIHIYKDPAGTFLVINGLNYKKSDVDLYDMLGRHIYHQDIENNTETKIDLMNLNSGLYIMSINQANKHFSFKIIL